MHKLPTISIYNVLLGPRYEVNSYLSPRRDWFFLASSGAKSCERGQGMQLDSKEHPDYQTGSR